MKLKDTPQDPFVQAVKYFALCLLAIGCYRVYSYVGTYARPSPAPREIPSGDGRIGEYTLIHSVGLLDSEDPFFVRIGLSRMKRLIRTENGARKVIEVSLVKKCQMLLDSQTDRSCPPARMCFLIGTASPVFRVDPNDPGCLGSALNV